MLTTTVKEPSIARFTPDKAMVKDRFYYKGNEISWNKPARTNDKYYPYFHKQQDDNKDKIEAMKNQELEEKKVSEEMRRTKLINLKAEDKAKLSARTKEREVIQRMSNQPVSQNYIDLPEDDLDLAYNIVAKKLNAGKRLRSDEFSWNNLDQASKKNVNIYLGNYSVKGEEEMLNKIKEKLYEENQKEDKKKRRRSEFHDKIRFMFVNRQEENASKLMNIGRPYTAKSSISMSQGIRSPTEQIPLLYANPPQTTKRSQINFSIDAQSKDPISSCKRYTRVSVTPSLDKLAVSREAQKKEFSTEHPDMKGMLVRNIDDQIFLHGNDFHEALISQSKAFHGMLEEKNNIKKALSNKTLKSRPPTSLSNKTAIQVRPCSSQSKFAPQSNLANKPYNSDFVALQKNFNTEPEVKNLSERGPFQETINSKDVLFQEIQEFENAFCRGVKKVGYPGVNLEEAYRLTSAKGLAASQKIAAKKKEQVGK